MANENRGENKSEERTAHEEIGSSVWGHFTSQPALFRFASDSNRMWLMLLHLLVSIQTGLPRLEVPLAPNLSTNRFAHSRHL
jgi:hypothetical protein